MYAYCFNNPVNSSDPTGNWPKWLKNTVSEIGKKAKAVVSKVKKQISSINWGRVADKATQTAASVANNVEVSAGIGLGLMAEANVADMANVGIGITYNLVQITLNDGAIYAEQSMFQGLNCKFLFFDVFPNAGEQGTRRLAGNIGEFKPKNDQNWTIFDAGAYFIAGGSVYVGFDTISFCEDIYRIYFYE